MDDGRRIEATQMSEIERAIEPHARLAVLRHLAEAPGYCLPILVLRDLLHEAFMKLSMQRLEAVLEWLGKEQLVHLHRTAGVIGVEVRERGGDVAEGLAIHEGVARPLPRSGSFINN
nr:hypothetical protein [Nitrosomonas nitrosa]